MTFVSVRDEIKKTYILRYAKMEPSKKMSKLILFPELLVQMWKNTVRQRSPSRQSRSSTRVQHSLRGKLLACQKKRIVETQRH